MAKTVYPQFTAGEIAGLVRKADKYYEGGLSHNRPPYYEGLIGRRVDFRYDNGAVLAYNFSGLHALSWSDGGEPKEERYDALTVTDDIVFVEHIVRGSEPQRARMIVWDMKTNLVTTFFAVIGNEYSTREVDRDIVFGYADFGQDAPAERHSLTKDLIGRSFIWTYGPGFTIQHIYASEWYSCFVDFSSPIGGVMLDSPCNYVKINDYVYIYSWVETEGAGIQGFALMNLHNLHDVGCFFGINGESRFECYSFSTLGEYAGQLTNLNIPNDYAIGHPWPPAVQEEAGKHE